MVFQFYLSFAKKQFSFSGCVESWKNYDLETPKNLSHTCHTIYFFFFSQNWPSSLLRWGGRLSPRSPTPTTWMTTYPSHPRSRPTSSAMKSDLMGMSAKSYTKIPFSMKIFFLKKIIKTLQLKKFHIFYYLAFVHITLFMVLIFWKALIFICKQSKLITILHSLIRCGHWSRQRDPTGKKHNHCFFSQSRYSVVCKIHYNSNFA